MLDKPPNLMEAPLDTKEHMTKVKSQDVEIGSLVPLQTTLKRRYTRLDIIAIGYNICNSWIGVASSFALAVSSGGSVTLIYGIILVSFVFLCNGGTLAELASVFPTAGGQYHFASILAPKKYSRGISYACGLIAMFSWIAAIAAVAVLLAQMLLAMALNYHGSYELKSWHTFLVYMASHTFTAGYNLIALRRTKWLYDIGFFLSVSMFLIVTITCVVRAPDRPTSTHVWATFVNASGGWSDGVTFLMGTLTPQFMFVGLDGAMHLAEDCQDPARVVPQAIMSTVIMGSFAAFVFAVGMSYSIIDVESVMGTRTQFPIYDLFILASRSEVAATILLVFILFCLTITLTAIQESAARMTWAFARDKGLVGSKFFGRMHMDLEVPIYALAFNYVAVTIIGILIIASSAVFNAIIGTTGLLQQISFGIPAALMLWRRSTSTDFLPVTRSFRMPRFIGAAANAICVVWTCLILVFYVLPTTFPVSGTSMNYSSAVLAIIALFAIANWFLAAKRHYTGPVIGFTEGEGAHYTLE